MQYSNRTIPNHFLKHISTVNTYLQESLVMLILGQVTPKPKHIWGQFLFLYLNPTYNSMSHISN